MSKKLFHKRNGSGELDVFEAANYFAGVNDHQVSNCHNKLFREGCNNTHAWRSRRMSLDMPIAIQLSSTPFGKSSHQMEKPAAAIKGKCKLPSSPGGKLASFLNSIFNQKHSSKKKKKLKSGAMNDEDAQSPGGWIRRRRSSLSEVYQKTSPKTASYYNHNNNVASSNNSGFRTPPPYPKKSCQDNNNNNHKAAENMIKFDDDDDDYDGGAESDSSSDLFDLPNRELLDYYSSGLPVYQNTKMDSIKSCAQISATVI